jgi:molybdopterin molybdotransferase
VEEAQAILADAAVATWSSETVPLRDAIGRVCARTVRSRTAIPAFDNAAMDGVALRCSDVAANGPWALPLAGRIAAGEPPRALPSGAAIAILTGAPIPQGADCVVRREAVSFCDASRVRLRARPAPGADIRRAGEDIRLGAPLARSGDVLNLAGIGLLAAGGAAEVAVRARPRVQLLCTGDELARPGATLAPGQIHDANGPMLAAMLTAPWMEQRPAGHVEDRAEAVRTALMDAATINDVVVMTGGASGGETDHLARALRDLGADMLFGGIAMRPGKPMKVARLRRSIVVGLPGNPYAAVVCAVVFLLPFLRRVAGLPPCLPRSGRSGFSWPARIGRSEFLPVAISPDDPGMLCRTGGAASARLRPAASAQGIAELAAGPEIRPGVDLRWWPLPGSCA